ncbi:lipoyl(octanoyl) transferase [Batrachochytrium salamandrivorans]|nr:lipoyl(octanoyl) transferase [Batrachochytrium salamandrivorans]
MRFNDFLMFVELHPNESIHFNLCRWMSRIIAVKWLGNRVPYARALAVQSHLLRMRILHAASTASSSASNLALTNGLNTPSTTSDVDVLLLMEHPPTFTAGRRIKGTDLTEGTRLRQLGADYFETLRGGQTTFHGPGQLIGYPIIDLRKFDLGVRCYVDRLEKTLMSTCERYHINARTTKDTGVWVDDRKIAALGIHVSHHISMHGFALNCNTDLSWFDHIVPCGLVDKKATSITNEILLSSRQGSVVTAETAMPAVVESFGKLFGASMRPLRETRVSSRQSALLTRKFPGRPRDTVEENPTASRTTTTDTHTAAISSTPTPTQISYIGSDDILTVLLGGSLPGTNTAGNTEACPGQQWLTGTVEEGNLLSSNQPVAHRMCDFLQISVRVYRAMLWKHHKSNLSHIPDI